MDEGTEDTGQDVPPAQRHIIRRPRLEKLLDETDARIILLVAPAGYGKTTLARQWRESRRATHIEVEIGPPARDVAALALTLAVAAGREAESRVRAVLSRIRDPDAS